MDNKIEMKLQEGFTYVFDIKGEMGVKPSSKFRRKIWQIVPSVCACMICLPFGLMLGWPSPIYPRLIQRDAPVFLTMDQTAMVAGFLLIGNTLGSPCSSTRKIGSKYGILVAATFVTTGWLLMWQARNIYWLLGSRLVVGLGNGFGVGQLRYYIAEICQDSLAVSLTKQVNLYALSGLLLAFAFGPFVDFRQYSIISVIVSILVLFLTIFLPSTPRELVQSDKIKEATKLIAFLSPHLDVGEEMRKIKERINATEKRLSFCDIMRDSSLRRNFLVFAFAVFFQQFSGAPATIVYCQIIFAKSGCPSPELCAILYAFTYFLATAYGIYCVPNYNKKNVMLFSSVGVSVLILLKIIVIVERSNETFWEFTSLVVLLLFITVHTVGLGTVPSALIAQLLPKEAKLSAVNFFTMSSSMLALIITKISQVLMHQIGLFAPFCLFLIISTFSIIFVIVFVPNEGKSEKT